MNPKTEEDVNSAHQIAVAEKLVDAFEKRFNVLYIDETSFTWEIGVKRGYAPKGQKVIFKHNKPCFSIGMLAAINSEGFEGILLRNGMNN